MSTIEQTWHAGFGMPASGRIRPASPRVLPTGSVLAQDACVLIAADGHQAVVTDAVRSDARTNAFPGTSAWSPPI